jgi:uncharacterized protein DUF4349
MEAMRKPGAVVGMVAMAGLGLVACGGPTRSDKAAGIGAGVPGSGVQPVILAQASSPADRQIAYTAELRLRTDDVERASSRAIQTVERNGGYLFGQDADLEGDVSGRLIFKVAPARFRSVLDSLARLGTVHSRIIKADDVTAQVVDVDGRLQSAETSAQRLRGLLAGAGDVAGVVAVEAELTKREAEIESMQGRLRTLREQVDLATITLQLGARDQVAVSGDIPGFSQGVRAGWVALVNTLKVSAAVTGSLLPFLPVVALPVVALRRHRRRGRLPAVASPE